VYMFSLLLKDLSSSLIALLCFEDVAQFLLNTLEDQFLRMEHKFQALMDNLLSEDAGSAAVYDPTNLHLENDN
jgi:hypothetical protein